MKKAIFVSLAIISFSGALAAGSVMKCPDGSQVQTAINQPYTPNCTANFCASQQSMASMIESAHSIAFKGTILQEDGGLQIVRCLYSSSKGSLDVALNPKLANAQYAAFLPTDPHGYGLCISTDPTICEFQTNTQV